MNVRRITFFATAALASGLLAMPTAQAATEMFSAKLLGDNEVPPINSGGTATPHMEVGSTITFSITFSGLSSTLVVSHLHFAPSKEAGGVMIFLCDGGGQPACPATTSGTITGTITAANVVGPAAQGISAPISLQPSKPWVMATPMPICTRRTFPGARFADKCSGDAGEMTDQPLAAALRLTASRN